MKVGLLHWKKYWLIIVKYLKNLIINFPVE